MLKRGEAQVAVLPPTRYLPLIADDFPIVLVANLLANDGINLIVHRSTLEERHISPTQPIKDRLIGLQGLKIGVAHGPPTRLRALYASEGLNADDKLTLVYLKGRRAERRVRQERGRRALCTLAIRRERHPRSGRRRPRQPVRR